MFLLFWMSGKSKRIVRKKILKKAKKCGCNRDWTQDLGNMTKQYPNWSINPLGYNAFAIYGALWYILSISHQIFENIDKSKVLLLLHNT
jgi:hypothetical protein